MKYARVAVPVPLTPLDKLLDYEIPEQLRGQVQRGSLVTVPFGKQKLWALVFEVSDKVDYDPAKVKSILDLRLPEPVLDVAKLNFISWLSKHYFYPIGEVCEAALPAPVRLGSAKVMKAPTGASDAPTTNIAEFPKKLNPAQRTAVDNIGAMSSGTHLLWGVTGSGKTEVYLQAIADKLRAGKSALVLVPEISLTPQLTQRFEQRFPGQVAIFHSGLKPAQMRKAWLETLYGRKRIAIGARSAIFAPLKDLGIIIVDEEHDGSYKQEDRLRYNARDGAIVLGGLCKAPVILGSATPSAETLYAVTLGRSQKSELPERATGVTQLPPIEIVDLRKNIAEDSKVPVMQVSEETELPSIKGDFFLSLQLRAALGETLHAGKQTILFLNRRGLGSQEVCRYCGHTPACPNCDVNLTPHGHALVCHYCAFETKITADCSFCKRGDQPYIRVGVGTEAIEHSVLFHFPRARVLRLDRDTTTSIADFEETLGKFNRKEADVLIGTQMVAKGHDFPDVTLVGILLAEMGLAVPDCRANERCLQLLLQVSGRAGRGMHPGKVILQTFQPDHVVFESLVKQRQLKDYSDFMEAELERRKPLNYPPFGRLVLLRFDGLDAGTVEAAADSVGAALKRIRSAGLQVLGPVESPLKKIRNRYRWQILLKADTFESCHKAVTWIMEGWTTQKLERKFQTRLVVDMDPMSML